MGSCIKEKGAHLHLYQGKCFQCNIEQNTNFRDKFSMCMVRALPVNKVK